jgi:ribosomal protein L11 methyltransferase
MQWLEISLLVNGELAEAVAEVLGRFAPDGVVIESTVIEDNLKNEGQPAGPLRVAAYIPLDEKIEQTRQRIEESLWHLGRIQPLPAHTFKIIQEINWSDAWKKHYRPIPVGSSLMIIPDWLESPDGDRIAVRIDPGMAFGTGTHPSTQLCLAMLEDYLPVGGDVIDVGCGSGILSIASLKLGAGRAFGVDIEVDSVEAAVENAAANQVADRAKFVQGSVEMVRSGIFEIRRAPLVLSNILAHILKRLLDTGLTELVSPGGILILSGVLEEQVDEMTEKISTVGLHVVDRRQMDDWVAFALKQSR